MIKGRRWISAILTVCLLLGNIPAFVYAGEPEGATPTELVEVVYDFALENTTLVNTSNQSFAQKSLTGTANQGAIAQYYNNGDIKWRYAADNVSSFSNSPASVSLFGGGTYPWSGLRLGVVQSEGNTYPVGYWTAFTIKVP